MKAQLTEFLLRLTFAGYEKRQDLLDFKGEAHQDKNLCSEQILEHIYATLNNKDNYIDSRSHKMSLQSDETGPASPTKCNCKKSKCLKLYCECFAKGSFCKGCNCECCLNTNEFSEIRARAIDEMLLRVTPPFGRKSTSLKGCNCKKTGCQKKYCECRNSGVVCNEYCKCTNCENCS